MKNKIVLYISIFINIVCLIIIVLQSIQLLNNYKINKNNIVNIESNNIINNNQEIVIPEKKPYHCESNYEEDNGKYIEIKNYDFIYQSNDLVYYLGYDKYIFKDKQNYNEFSKDYNVEDYAYTQDNKNLIKIYENYTYYISENKSLEEYIDYVETELNGVCKKVEKDKIMFYIEEAENE